jgi:peptidoglycan/LPS O-acetylase OafA/YrhL
MRLSPLEGLSHAQSRILGLDLMRAIAILLVMASHWSNNILYWFGIHTTPTVWFSGDVGVAMFFALSGFLIGQILINETSKDSSSRNLGIFLTRRWMRTLPLYFLMLAILLVFTHPIHSKLDYAIHFGTLTQNLFQPMPGGPDWWFSVSWSLTIEEWFYVSFGCAAFLSFRVIRAPWAIWVPIAIFLTVPLVLRFTVPGFSDRNLKLWTMVPFRIDEIAYGVAMAALYARRSRIFSYPFACLAVGVALIASTWSGHMPVPTDQKAVLIYNVTMTGCALLLPAALRLRRAPDWFSTIAKTISAQSYGLYIIHETLLVTVAQELWWFHVVSAWGCVAIAVISPFILSYLSFRFLESPILRLRPKHRATEDRAYPAGDGVVVINHS